MKFFIPQDDGHDERMKRILTPDPPIIMVHLKMGVSPLVSMLPFKVIDILPLNHDYGGKG